MGSGCLSNIRGMSLHSRLLCVDASPTCMHTYPTCLAYGCVPAQRICTQQSTVEGRNQYVTPCPYSTRTTYEIRSSQAHGRYVLHHRYTFIHVVIHLPVDTTILCMSPSRSIHEVLIRRVDPMYVAIVSHTVYCIHIE